MKKIMMGFMIACLAGCSYFISTEELARNIQGQMQREFNANPDYQDYHLKVLQVKIVQRTGNGFQAISQLSYQGHEYPIEVQIAKAGGGYNWSIEKDAFTFIDEIEIEKYRQQLDRELAQLAASLEPVNEATTLESVANSYPAVEPVLHSASDNVEPIPVGNITAYSQ